MSRGQDDDVDYPRSVGAEALGARLRRVSERIDREASQVYVELDIEFEQRWFGVLNQLRIHKTSSVTEIARRLRMTHVSVSQVRASLARAGLIESTTSPADGRRKELKLTAAGHKFIDRLKPTWTALAAAAIELEAEADVLDALNRLEDALERRSLVDRALQRVPQLDKT